MNRTRSSGGRRSGERVSGRPASSPARVPPARVPPARVPPARVPPAHGPTTFGPEQLEDRLLMAFSANVNFQPATTPVPAGYAADTGKAYGPRGNGLTFGWNKANNNAIDRNSPRSPDQRHDTFNYLQAAGAGQVWEIAVPNGSYSVKIVGGDPNVAGTHNISAENVLTVSGRASGATSWLSGTKTVAVTDGRLTVRAAAGAATPKINFVEVRELSASPPASPPPASPPPTSPPVPPPPVSPPPPVTGTIVADLMNSTTDQPIARLTDGFVIDMNAVGTKLNIRATPVGTPGSVVFKLDGVVVGTETSAPYGIGGDWGGTDFKDWTPPAGTHTVEILQYSQPKGAGTVVAATTFGFTAIPPGSPPVVPPTVPPTSPPTSPPPPPPPTGPVGGPQVELMDATTNGLIRPLADGDTIDMNVLGTKLNLRAVPAGAASRVEFRLNGLTARTDGSAPYTVSADGVDDYLDWAPPTGPFTLQVDHYDWPAGAADEVLVGTTTLGLTGVGPASPPTSPPPVSPPPVPPPPPNVPPPPPVSYPGLPPAMQSSQGFVPLFDGQTLAGFDTFIDGRGVNSDPQGYFRAENGMLRVLGMGQTNTNMPFGYIVTEDAYSDYRLRFQYKWGATKFAPRNTASTPRDSGLLLHTVGSDRIWPTSFEVQIQERDTGDTWLLDPGRAVTATTTVESTSAGTKKYREGGASHTQTGGRIIKSQTVDSLTDWNTVDVIAEGNTFVTMVNGVVVNRATNVRGPDGRPLMAGRIGFQAEGAEIWYRDIQIKPLAQPAPPAGAVRLFDSSSSKAGWQKRNGGGPIGWAAANGELTVTPGTGDIRTNATFRDFRLHLEFNTNVKHAGVTEQDRGNSGVGLLGSYELQVLDSYGRSLSGTDDLGAIYGVRAPSLNAALPAGAWQSYDVTFKAPVWNGNVKVANARATVYLNGHLIHDNVEIPGATFTFLPESPAGGPIVLQDHGNAVRYRNIWVVPE